jgi:hypothetical protein
MCYIKYINQQLFINYFVNNSINTHSYYIDINRAGKLFIAIGSGVIFQRENNGFNFILIDSRKCSNLFLGRFLNYYCIAHCYIFKRFFLVANVLKKLPCLNSCFIPATGWHTLLPVKEHIFLSIVNSCIVINRKL